MAIDPRPMRMSVEEYFLYDRDSQLRHEYLDGYAVAMSDGTMAHNRLTLNMAVLLMEPQKCPCRVYASDVRVRVAEKRYYYPDVVVSCNVDDHRDNNDMLRSPHLIVEVLSNSTEARDRGEKLTAYQQCECVQEYMLVNTRIRRVEAYCRQADGEWDSRIYENGQEVVCESLDIQIPIASLYAGVRIPAELPAALE